MKREPGFYFFPRDWLSDSSVRQASYAARGLWIDLLALMWGQTPRGVLPGDLRVVAQMFGIPGSLAEIAADEIKPLVDELSLIGVLSTGRQVDKNITPNALVNRRMYREWVASNDVSQKRSAAAKIRWERSQDES